MAFMSDVHSRIIAAAAKAQLGSLGFYQQGRSRLWLADRGSWLNAVEFTPSKWSKSVSLVNAAHWLWVDVGFISFDVVVPSQCHAAFETEDQFMDAASKIANIARANALDMENRFKSFDAIADWVIQSAQLSPDGMGQSWWGYQAGIASGLIGKFDEASRFLRSVSDDQLVARAASLISLVAYPDAFKKKANEILSQERAVLKLKPLDCPAF